jgi:putative copper resistance protein D
MTSLAVHVGAAVLWVGGLAAVAWLALGNRPHLDVALPRFSRLAFGCFAAVLVSGVVNAAIRLGSVQALWQDHYGLLVLAKVAALVVLGLFGARHRNRSLAAVEAGSHRPFLRLAALELAVMAATVGLAVGLSKSPTPVARSVPDVSPAKAALGYELPGPISVDRLLDWGQPQLVFLLLVALGVLGYARGLMRVRADGSSWPVTRSAAWLAGLAVVAAATQSGLSRYGAVLFSVHVGQFVLLALVAPVLLVLGAPLTLALRTLRPAEAGRGARGWVVAAVRSPLLRLLTRPLVALAVLAVGSAGLFFTGLFDGLMREHAGHLAMELFFLAGGFLFAWAMVGPDPLPRRARLAERLPVLVASGALVAAFSIALRSSKAALGESWFGGLGRSWGPSLLADQHTGALVVLIGGEVAVLLMLLAALLSRSSVSAGGGTRTEVPERRSGREPSPVEG